MLKKLITSLALLLVSLHAQAAGPLVLISEQEARLPAGDVPKSRGITRGPTLELLSPKAGSKSIKAPLDFKVRFVPHGGASINADSVQVLYVKSTSIDLTERIASQISDSGINVSNATMPPGEHVVMVSVQDSSGRRGESVFTLKVEK